MFAMVIFTANTAFGQADGQADNTSDKAAIKAVVSTFMACLIKKDSVKFYNLFSIDPVAWVGVFKDRTTKALLKRDSTQKNYITDNYKDFYRSISDLGLNEEKFYNVRIDNDESVAAVFFDYSFWAKGEKLNWGKESWHLVKIKDSWKITSVIFSMDFEKINPEPK